MSRHAMACLAVLTLLFVAPDSSLRAKSKAPIDPWVFAHSALNHFYNLEYDDAIRELKKAIELDPQNAFFYNYLATTYLFKQLYLGEYLDAGLFSATNDFLQAKRIQPDPTLIRPMLDALRRAKQISEERLRQNPNDVEANYTLGAAYAIEANYEFNLNKRYLAALQGGNKAKNYHDRAIALDPNYHDANLVRGAYEYVVGSIPPWIKWLAFLGGYHGSKENGILLLQDAMTRGRYVTTDAAVLLTVIYYREKKYAYVRQILSRLREFYPRNHLLPLQIALTYMREGTYQQAVELYEQVARGAETGQGFTGLRRDKLYYQLGVLLENNGDPTRALAYYDRIAGMDSSEGVLRAYALLREGEIYLGQKRAEKAQEMFRAAAAMPYAEPRQVALARLKALETQGR